jgi:hypothetical protein
MGVRLSVRDHSFLIVAGIFIGLQIANFFYITPAPDPSGDAAKNWELARELALGNPALLNSSEVMSHHYMRWGIWLLPTVLNYLFSDGIAVYFLSSILPATAAAIVFIYLVTANLGALIGGLFALLWFFDPQVNRETFQLMPTAAGLLPLSLLLLAFHLYARRQLSVTTLTAASGVLMFWLYGAKETNIFFGPGIVVVLFLVGGLRSVAIFAAICAALYVVETLAFRSLTDAMSYGGRLHELVSKDAPHMSGMMKRPNIVAEQSALWDAGIISRWYRVLPGHIPVYFGSIALFAYFLWKGPPAETTAPARRLAFMFAALGASFAFCTSFFILSLDPIRLGQPLRARYLAILLPVSYFVLLYMLHEGQKRYITTPQRAQLVTAGGLAAAVLGVLFLQHGAGRGIFRNAKSLGYWRAYYADVGRRMPDTVCIRPRGKVKIPQINPDYKLLTWNLMYVPLSERQPGFNTVYTSDVKKVGSLFVRGPNDKCRPEDFIIDPTKWRPAPGGTG